MVVRNLRADRWRDSVRARCSFGRAGLGGNTLVRNTYNTIGRMDARVRIRTGRVSQRRRDLRQQVTHSAHVRLDVADAIAQLGKLRKVVRLVKSPLNGSRISELPLAKRRRSHRRLAAGRR